MLSAHNSFSISTSTGWRNSTIKPEEEESQTTIGLSQPEKPAQSIHRTLKKLMKEQLNQMFQLSASYALPRRNAPDNPPKSSVNRLC
jgi:hypothetical protein